MISKMIFFLRLIDSVTILTREKPM